MIKQGIYVHIPFCGSKCLYCDFFSGGARGADWKRLADALINELKDRFKELKSPDSCLSTLYIGGGTPSLIPEEEFAHLVAGINYVTCREGKWDEFTIEVNPEDVTQGKCVLWRKSGVNRISMGVQSFSDEELRSIGRRHTAEKAVSSFRLLREYFDNISIDLMFGLPGQTLESLLKSIGRALTLKPDHLSAYSLMFEEGTAMTVLRNQGRLKFPDDEECVAMWKMLSCELGKAGYRQYEISNYSIPGRESLHNRRYWLGNPYLGIGPSAHSYDGIRTRKANPLRIREYLERYSPMWNAGQKESLPEYQDMEILTDDELLEEHIMLRMRMAEGIDLNEYSAKFGKEEGGRLLKNAERGIKAGNLTIEDNHIHLTQDGIMKSDEIIVSLMR